VDLRWTSVLHELPADLRANVDQELGWTKEEFKKIGSSTCIPLRKENDCTRTTSHLDNLIRFGAFPPSTSTRHPPDRLWA